MTRNRTSPDAGFVHNPSKLPRGPNGRVLCRRCGEEVPKGRRTFCGDACVHEWRLRTDTGYVRQQVEKRDHGICGSCGLDTERFKRWFDRIKDAAFAFRQRTHYKQLLPKTPRELRRFEVYCRAVEYLVRCGWGSKWWRMEIDRLSEILSRPMSPSFLGLHLWEADHIVPVSEGGGECGLEGYRTLCLPCHRRETKALARRRAAAKKEAAGERKDD